MRVPVQDQTSAKTKQSQKQKPVGEVKTAKIQQYQAQLNKELGRKGSFGSGHLRDFQSDNEGDAPGSKIRLDREARLRTVDHDAISQRVGSKVDGALLSDQEHGKAAKGNGLKSHANISESESDYGAGSRGKRPGKVVAPKRK